MVGVNYGGVEVGGPRKCGRGHVMTRVRRADGFRDVCPRCLGAVLSGAAARQEAVSVNDYLAAADGGSPPALPRVAAEAGAKLLAFAAEMYGDADAACGRKVVRDVARREGVPTADVMRWPVQKIAEAIDRLAAVAV